MPPRVKSSLFLLWLSVSVLSASGQDARRGESIKDIDFKTERRGDARVDVRKGVIRSQYREFDDVVYRSPDTFIEKEKSAYGWNNPSADLKVVGDVRLGFSRHVTYQQTFKELPVLDHQVRVNMDRFGRVSMVVSAFNSLEVKDENFDVVPLVDGKRAEEIAFQEFAEGRGRHSQATLGVIQPSAPVLVWEVMVWPESEPAEYRVQIDAKTGKVSRAIDQVLSRSGKGQTLAQTDGSGLVFDPDPLNTAGVNYGAPYLDGSDGSNSFLDNARKEVVLRDLSLDAFNRYVLKGPYVSITGFNQGGTLVYTPPSEVSPDGFRYTRSESGFEAVNAYYHLDKSQRYVQSLGFQDRLAVPLDVNPQGLTRDDSFFFPSSNIILFGTGGVDDAEDPTVLWHEYAHALLESVAPNLLSTQEGQAFHEGWADYWAASYLRSQVETGESKRADWQKLFAWDSGDGALWSGRTLNHMGHYPEDLCVTTSQFNCSPHNDGLLWATTMMEVYDQLGRGKTDRLSLLSHAYLIAPLTFTDAAEAVIQADLDYYNGDDVAVLVNIFSARGLVDSSDYGPVLAHTPLADTESTGGTVDVQARAIGISAPIAQFEVFWESTTDGLQSRQLLDQGSNSFVTSIVLPAQQETTVFYYVRAEDAEGRVSYLPEDAPLSRYHFVVGPDVTAPIISHAPVLDGGFLKWPLAFQTTVTDNLAVDSVTLEYSLMNSSGEVEAFGEKALTSQGSLYSSVLDLPFSQLKKGSKLAYALRAVDASLASNETRYPESGFIHVEITAEGDLRKEGFEVEQNELFTSTGLWESGSPAFGRAVAMDGENVIATLLDTPYPAVAGMSTIEFSPINLKGVDPSYLSFWHYYDTENDGLVTPDVQGGRIWDGGLVQIRTESSSAWTTISPEGGYPGVLENDLTNPLHGEPAFGGNSFGWRQAFFELPPEDGLEIRLVFATNASNEHPSVAYAGWMVDQVLIGTERRQDDVAPVVSNAPPNQRVVSVSDPLGGISFTATDDTGVVDALMHWTFTSSQGVASGLARLSQDPSDLTRFSVPLTMAAGAVPGDRLDYVLEVRDPSGNTARVPDGVSQNSLLFRIRESSSPVESVWATGGWAQSSGLWSVNGASEMRMSSLNLNPILIPENAVAAALTIQHAYQFGTQMGGQLEVSGDKGSSWTVVEPAGGYPGQVISEGIPSMVDEKAFVGSSQGSVISVFDLSAWKGTSILVRISAASEPSASSSRVWTLQSIGLSFESDESEFEVPRAFEVHPPYPNPFSDRANVAFTLTEADLVDIRLYDVLGREVATISEGVLAEGAHSIVVERGNLVPGIYLLRVRAGERTRVQKLVIVDL